MKLRWMAALGIGLGATAFAQGTITFFNNNIINASGQTYRAGIYQDNDPGGFGDTKGDSTIGAGSAISIGLFLPGSITPLNYTDGAPAVTTGRSGTTPEVFARTGDVIVPGAVPNSTVVLVVKAWTTAAGSYEAAENTPGYQWGQATFTSKPLGGTNPNPPPPSFFTPDMAPFTGFEMESMIPEPSTIALGIVGLGALIIRRRSFAWSLSRPG